MAYAIARDVFTREKVCSFQRLPPMPVHTRHRLDIDDCPPNCTGPKSEDYAGRKATNFLGQTATLSHIVIVLRHIPKIKASQGKRHHTVGHRHVLRGHRSTDVGRETTSRYTITFRVNHYTTLILGPKRALDDYTGDYCACRQAPAKSVS
jgi:hypothetical protein